MSKSMDLQSLGSGILFCISSVALIIACLAFTKKGGGEYYRSCGAQAVLGKKKKGDDGESAFITAASSPSDVKQWLKAKGFSSK